MAFAQGIKGALQLRDEPYRLVVQLPGVNKEGHGMPAEEASVNDINADVKLFHAAAEVVEGATYSKHN
jgi:hypothetical protein